MFAGLRVLRVVASETFQLLRRDKVFLPVIVIGVLITGIANLASDWSIEDFAKILFDIGYFGFNTTGSLVALFWGAKAITDSRQEGSLEVQLAAPINRPLWLLGKFIGMALALCFISLVLLVVWQALIRLNDFGWMPPRHLLAHGFMTLGWLVAAALAMLFASFCRQAVALFAALTAWLIGLASALVMRALAPETGPLSRAFVSAVARFWDLQQLNLSTLVQTAGPLDRQELLWRGSYGALLLAVLLTGACLIFARRDVIA